MGKTKRKINNLLYIDDLKVYARNKEEMERCRALIEMFSKDIQMEFGLSKCAVIHIEKGQIIDSPCVNDIPLLTPDESYKYLGILQADTIKHKEVKEKTKREYFKRVREILKSELNAKFTANAITTYAMPILRYGFGILKWTRSELRAIDTKTRKTLTKYGYHHPKSNVHRLYLSRKWGGRGIISAMDCHTQECTALAAYMRESETDGKDPLVKLVAEVEKGKTYGIMSYSAGLNNRNADETREYHNEELLKMKLHGDYFKRQNEVPNIDMGQSYAWLHKFQLRFETESLLCAAQEQALATKYVRSKIWKKGKDVNCRLCGEQNETVSHIVSGCKMLAATQYLHRHNQVGKYLHWCILKDIGVQVKDSWLQHKPEEVVQQNDIIVMWDKSILTAKKVGCNRPDITIHDTKARECIFVDVSIPVCDNVIKKEAEKITKYRDLEIEVQKCWNLRKVTTIPVVVGALGTVSKGINQFVRDLAPNISINTVQKTALLGTAHILRNFLTPIKNSSS